MTTHHIWSHTVDLNDFDIPPDGKCFEIFTESNAKLIAVLNIEGVSLKAGEELTFAAPTVFDAK